MEQNANMTLANIFILDWDDSLFPTYWVQQNGIDLKNPVAYQKHKLYFIELDKQISSLLQTLNEIGEIFIVSNASGTWLQNSISILPLTKRFLADNDVSITSARDDNPEHDIEMWKVISFKNVADEFIQNAIKKTNGNNLYINVISIGDAHWEYVALLNLDDFIKTTKLKYFLKNVKFMDKPTFEDIIDQNKVLVMNIGNIVNKMAYVDISLKK
jgi:hypothetical protein